MSELISYKKYIKEVDVFKLKSLLVKILYANYQKSLDEKNLVLTEGHIPYLKGISDTAEIAIDVWKDNCFKNLKKEVDDLILYIRENKEVRMWNEYVYD